MYALVAKGAEFTSAQWAQNITRLGLRSLGIGGVVPARSTVTVGYSL